MENLKIKITLKSSIITPFHSDTIFGHICWAYLYMFGEDDFIENFLKTFETENPAIVLSNAFPENYLPMPVLPSDDNDSLNLSQYKQFKKFNLIEKSIFDELNEIGITEKNIYKQYNNDDFSKISVSDGFLHTAINRITNTALENKLYEQEETFYDQNKKFDLYCKITSPMTKEKLKKCFEYLNISGFGKDKSTGKGHVEFKISDESVNFNISNADANGFLNLSNYMPRTNDPISGFYSIFTKYGKLGGHYANSSRDESDIIKPFKKPVMMITPGSTFYSGSIKEFYGRVVNNLKIKENKFIKHYGISYPIPINIGAVNA